MAEPVTLKNEMDELEKRLIKMDFKLQKVKETRDEYVNFLRQKYPHWKPPEMHPYTEVPKTTEFRSRILDNLATSKYHWDLGHHRFTPQIGSPTYGCLEPSDPIPSSGPASQPDLLRIKKRLAEIAEDLENLRERRLYLSTAEYYHTLGPEFWSSRNQEVPLGKPADVAQLERIYELRRQIGQIDTNVSPDTPRPDAEDRERIRAEYLAQKYTDTVTTKGVDESEGNFAKPTIDEEKNSSTFLGQQKKDSQNLPETQAANPESVEVSSLYEMLDILKQKSDQKPAANQNIATATAKSRPGKSEDTAQASKVPDASSDDGQSFLAKILGSSAIASTGKKSGSTSSSDDISKAIVAKNEDSDSDFFA